MLGLITWREQSVMNSIMPDIALNDNAESRKTIRPRPCRVHFSGNRRYLQKVMKDIITVVVIVVVLKNAPPGLPFTIIHVMVCLFDGNDKAALTPMAATWPTASETKYHQDKSVVEEEGVEAMHEQTFHKHKEQLDDERLVYEPEATSRGGSIYAEIHSRSEGNVEYLTGDANIPSKHINPGNPGHTKPWPYEFDFIRYKPYEFRDHNCQRYCFVSRVRNGVESTTRDGDRYAQAEIMTLSAASSSWG
jgi:hypothetical protein